MTEPTGIDWRTEVLFPKKGASTQDFSDFCEKVAQIALSRRDDRSMVNGPRGNDYRFCPNCGRKIVQAENEEIS